MSRKNVSSISNIRAIDHRRCAESQRSSRNYSSVSASESSKVEYKLSSNTLSINNQENNYFLDSIEIWISSPHAPLDKKDKASCQFQKYREAIGSLLHNIRFIENIQNIGTKNKTGELIDLNYIQKNNFEYNADIRTKYKYHPVSRPITDENELINKLINVLESSKQIVESMEKDIDADQLKKYEEVKSQIFRKADLLIILLQNNKIDLEIFSRAISFEDKKLSKFNHF